MFRLGVSYDNRLDCNVYHPKIVTNHGSFIPLKYSLTDLITQNFKKIILCFTIYEVYTTHVHCQETQIKKWAFLYFLKSVNFSNEVLQAVIWNTASLFPKFITVPCNLKKQLVRHIQLIFRKNLKFYQIYSQWDMIFSK